MAKLPLRTLLEDLLATLVDCNSAYHNISFFKLFVVAPSSVSMSRLRARCCFKRLVQ
jgi:hypothetical protein